MFGLAQPLDLFTGSKTISNGGGDWEGGRLQKV